MVPSSFPHADAYDASFARLCSGTNGFILSTLQTLVEPGSTVLDVGAGTGRLASEAGRAGLRVTAVEPESSMVRLARRRVPVTSVEWTVGSAPGLEFPAGTFDAVVANFVVNHVDRPLDVVSDLHRVARPGGYVISTIWSAESDALRDLWAHVIQASGAVPGPGGRLPPDRDFERSAAGLARLHRAAGATVVEMTDIAWNFIIDPRDLWQAVEGGIAGIGALYRGSTRGVQEAMSDAYRRIARQQARYGLLHLPSSAPCVVARNE